MLLGSSVGFASGMAFEELMSKDDSGNSGTNEEDNSNGNDTNDTNTEDTNTDESGDPSDLVFSDRPTLGDSDAPIKMFYWSDYQCPFCYRFESETLPEIRSRFVDSGDVELIVKPLSAFGKGSLLASLGSHCVLEQASSVRDWFLWHNMLYDQFQEIGERNNGWSSHSKQSTYADSFEFVNGADLESCINSEDYINRIQVDRTEADSFGFEGTPFFVFYNTETFSVEKVTGAQPISRFDDVISSMMSSE